MGEETARAGGSRLRHDDRDADQLGRVGQHLAASGRGQEDDGLVSPRAAVDVLLPASMLPGEEGTDPPVDELRHATPTGDMPVARHRACPFVGAESETASRVLLIRKHRVIMGAPLVVALVQRLERAAIHQQRHEAWLI
jgi:hypothetical protein